MDYAGSELVDGLALRQSIPEDGKESSTGCDVRKLHLPSCRIADVAG